VKCHACDVPAKIEAALKACATCPSKREKCGETCKRMAALRTRCMSCDPESLTRKGRSHVTCGGHSNRADLPLEATLGGALRIADDYAAAHAPTDIADILDGLQPEAATPLPPGVENALRVLVANFAALELCDVEILHGLLNGKSLADIARAYGYASRAAVHERFKEAVARHKWIARLFTNAHATAAAKRAGLAVSRTWTAWRGTTVMRRGSGMRYAVANIPGTPVEDLADDVRADIEAHAEADDADGDGIETGGIDEAYARADDFDITGEA